jgi:hypothetical protein
MIEDVEYSMKLQNEPTCGEGEVMGEAAESIQRRRS